MTPCRCEVSCKARRSALDILVPKGLTPGEQKQPVFYARGDVVAFRRDLTPHQQDPLEKGTYYSVAGTDQHGGRIQLQKDDGSFVIWRPGSHGARDAEVYVRERRELAAGDQITWTKNLPGIGAANGQTATVAAVEPARGSLTFEQNGRRITLDASSAEARHLDHGYAQTAQKLQGQTADRALIHAEHWRLNLVNQRSFYVLLSRAKDGVVLRDQRPGRPGRGDPRALRRAAGGARPARAAPGTGDRRKRRCRKPATTRSRKERRARGISASGSKRLPRERSDEARRKVKPGGRDADLGQERDGRRAANRQRDYDDDMGY